MCKSNQNISMSIKNILIYIIQKSNWKPIMAEKQP